VTTIELTLQICNITFIAMGRNQMIYPWRTK